jgi:hypothetical protein
MRKLGLGFALLFAVTSGWAQSKFFVKAGIGPSIPLGIFEDQETQEEAALAKTGTNLALTLGRDFHKNFGLSITGSTWRNPVDEDKAGARAVEQYPFVQELRISSQDWRFGTVYLSPHGTVRVGDWLRLDVRANAGLLWSQYPSFTGTGQGTDPRDGQVKPFTVFTQTLRGTSFVYGGGGTAAIRVAQQFHLFADVDGLRSRPQFPASKIQAGLGTTSGTTNLSLTQDRSEFRQKVGTLSVRLGAGLFF